MIRRALLVAALAATGCSGSPDDASDPGADAHVSPGIADAAPATVDGGAPAAADANPPGCSARDLDPAWLEAYERDVVGKLAGASAIAPGVMLADRFTGANREAVRVYLLAELSALGYTPERHVYETGSNVIARLPASGGGGARPVHVLGAHFDGISGIHAAADDGTGVALVLGAARWFAGLDCREADVIFAFFDQEESGLIGSNFYADKLKTDHEDVAAVHAFDMISWDADRDQALELWKPSPGLVALYEAAGAPLGVPVRVAPSFASSDHQSFVEAGFVTTGVSEEFVAGDHTPHYHKPTDTYENVDFEYLARVSRVAFAAISSQVAPAAP